MSLQEFLQWAATVDGVGGIVGFILSFFAEWIPGFEDLSPKGKRGATLAFSLIIPTIAIEAYYIIFQGSWPSGEVVFLALQAGFAFFYGSQFSHMRELPGGKTPSD